MINENGYKNLTLEELSKHQNLEEIIIQNIKNLNHKITPYFFDKLIGIRDNKYITASGMIKYFIDKMESRGKVVSMLNDYDETALITPNSKLKKDNIQGENNANKTHYNIGKNIREVITKNGGTMPEDLPTPKKSLKQLEKEKTKQFNTNN